MDHRQLEVRVGVVDRLPSRLGHQDERERERAEGESRARPGGRACRPRDHQDEVRGARDERRDGEREHERRFDEDGDREVAARSHQREPVRDVPGRRGDGEPREREEPGEHERVAADAEVGCVGRHRDEQHRHPHACGGDRRRDPVRDPRALHVDRALAPEAPELTVRLERSRAAPSLEARLPVLHEPGEERRERNPAEQLGGGRRGGRAAHPRIPSFAVASTTSTRPSR